MGLTTADVLREVAKIDAAPTPLVRWDMLYHANLRVSTFYRALYCGVADFVEYYVLRIHDDDLAHLVTARQVLESATKTAAARREIRRRKQKPFFCPECKKRFQTPEKALLHKLNVHQMELS